ncbi:unnamed protein product [Didymodactylos carnosus]|uniref:Uncharacterized protein n=1 Tax=Didymodactylos carnosus TaxID=1234261 RepID=A0A815T0N6_9BILA|nr:unnamed protein product [Didymodactylos carnosus]CAF1496889.1 unnamed protein product [Didymodactylos carnosus]CAF4106948.1 unnamed protein product [Didymodactylos carnosus]CAF4359232.1 unnamed protein product [Didymodactylos carnosus]
MRYLRSFFQSRSDSIPAFFSFNLGTVLSDLVQIKDFDWNGNITGNYTIKDRRYDRGFTVTISVYYIISIFIMIPTLLFAVKAYLDLAYKNAYLRADLLSTKRTVQDNVLKQLSSLMQQYIAERKNEFEHKRKYANIVASAYVVDAILYTGSFILYIIMEQDETDLKKLLTPQLEDAANWAAMIFYILSAFLILVCMCVANYQGDKVKTTAQYIYSTRDMQSTTTAAALDCNELAKAGAAVTTLESVLVGPTMIPANAVYPALPSVLRQPITTSDALHSSELPKINAAVTSLKNALLNLTTNATSRLSRESPISDSATLETILKYFDSYASFCWMEVRPITVLLFIVTHAIMWGVPIILTQHSKAFELKKS